jgi:GxxExxY protein
MVREYTRIDANEKRISERAIGCAYEVGNELGTGFLEAVYENALAMEMRQQGLRFEQQKLLKVFYHGSLVGQYVADFVVEDRLLIELKALSYLNSQHEAQVMNYLKATGITAGLLLNFGTPKVGIRRIVREHNDLSPI